MDSTSLSRRLREFRLRTQRYFSAGHDRFAAARFVAESVGSPSGLVLDVGTGKGLLAVALAERGLDVVSVDVSAEDQEVATALAAEAGLAGRIHFVLCDAVALPFPACAFDGAAMMDVLHHLGDAAPVLGEMARVVRPEGRIVAADFTAEGFDVVSRIHREEGKVHPRSEVTVERASEALHGLGWKRRGRVTGHLQDVASFESESGP